MEACDGIDYYALGWITWMVAANLFGPVVLGLTTYAYTRVFCFLEALLTVCEFSFVYSAIRCWRYGFLLCECVWKSPWVWLAYPMAAIVTAALLPCSAILFMTTWTMNGTNDEDEEDEHELENIYDV